MVFIPCNWHHATLNLDDVVALGGQFAPGTSKALSGCPVDVFGAATERFGQAMVAMKKGRLGEAQANMQDACELNPFHYRCGVDKGRLNVLTRTEAGGLAPIKSMAREYKRLRADGIISGASLATLLNTFAVELLTSPSHAGNKDALGLSMALLHTSLSDLGVPHSMVSRMLLASARLASSSNAAQTRSRLQETEQVLRDCDEADARGRTPVPVYAPPQRVAQEAEVRRQTRQLVRSIRARLNVQGTGHATEEL